jgi:hypothetical protein
MVFCSRIVEVVEEVASEKKRLVVFHFIFVRARMPPELLRRIINSASNGWQVFSMGKRATRSNLKISMIRMSCNNRCLILCDRIPIKSARSTSR